MYSQESANYMSNGMIAYQTCRRDESIGKFLPIPKRHLLYQVMSYLKHRHGTLRRSYCDACEYNYSHHLRGLSQAQKWLSSHWILRPQNQLTMDELYQRIYFFIGDIRIHLEDIAALCKISVIDTETLLLTLALENKVTEEPEKFFSRTL